MVQPILVTGGAGYIGSHVVRQLTERNERVVVLDNLATGYRSAVLNAPLIVGDTGDRALVDRVLAEHRVETVMHFAAHTIVPESVADPLQYYRNNTCATRNLFECCDRAGIRQIVFSSTAAVYGNPEGGIAREESPTQPINPYGSSKLMSEWMLRDLAHASRLRYVVLRYFNVAGSDPGGRIGHSAPNSTLPVKVACQHAMGGRSEVSVFGTDYPTPDGTGVRDYIHVSDLAEGHVAALRTLLDTPGSFTVNLGTGRGHSVLEVVRAYERHSGRPVPYEIVARRAGDVAACYADVAAAQQLLAWRATRDLDQMCADSWRWQQMNPDGFAAAE